MPSFCSSIMHAESLTSICRQSANNIVEAGHECWFISCLGSIKTSESKRQSLLKSFWTTLAAMIDRAAPIDRTETSSDCRKMILYQSLLVMKGPNGLVSSRSPVWNRSFFQARFFLQQWHDNQEQTIRLLHLSLKEIGSRNENLLLPSKLCVKSRYGSDEVIGTASRNV